MFPQIEGQRNLLALLGICLLAACGNGALMPADILPEDMCLHCKMAISQKRCAAEFMDKEGKSYKFDDLACMGSYIKERGNKTQIAAYFVADYEGGGWIKGEEASYVRASRISTPMGGGVTAFRDKAKAEAAAAKYQGELRNFAEVMP